MQNLWKTYDDITDILRKRKIRSRVMSLCQRLLLGEHLELKITDNQSDYFLKMLSENNLPFS